MTETMCVESALERIAERTRELYSLPEVAVRVLEITATETIDFAMLRETLECDPALYAKILRVANSSYFGLHGKVTQLQQALPILGSKLVRSLVLSFCLPTQLSAELSTKVLERFWRGTLYRATVARRLAEDVWHTSGDDLFVAGLLRGVGMLALLQELGGAYAEFMEQVTTDGGDLAAQEIAVMGFQHRDLSARMLAHWGLPESLVRLVAPVELSPLDSPDDLSGAILEIAEHAAEFLVSGQPSSMLLALDSATKLNGEHREGIREVLLALEPEVASLAPIFELTPPNHEVWQRLVNEAYQRLANVEKMSVHAVSVNTECRVLAAAEELRNELRNITSLLRTKLPGVQPPRAASPSITGGDLAREYPALSNRVALAIAHCRSQRCPLSIIMVAVDRTQQSAGLFGSTSFMAFCQWLRMACESELDTSHPLQLVGESGFVMLLEDCERFDAVAAARRLVEQVHRRSGQQGEPWRISAGVACLRLPSRNFPERELIAAAQRCLQGAQTSGGDTVKSLEL